MVNISPTEKEIMEALWSSEGMTNNEIMLLFRGKGKDWARQTAHTFLNRMVKKGLLKRENHRYYTTCSRRDFEAQTAREVLETVYSSSLTNFIAALNDSSERLSEQEIEKLREMIGGME